MSPVYHEEGCVPLLEYVGNLDLDAEVAHTVSLLWQWKGDDWLLSLSIVEADISSKKGMEVFKDKFETFNLREAEEQRTMMFYKNLTRSCVKKCVNLTSSSLESKERRCFENC